ncbi:cytidylate kinase family protein [Corynebacterium uterequi]|uniref:cytidylate kinase family protein n=1 Tax=Corynebacterium uterequi TaxID=1072256 RepID=UPI001EEE7B32|nr:cytidylate kinase family protein [Corynebacterium uterequi]
MSTTTAPAKATANGQMPSHRVLTYSFGDIANNLSFMMTSMFLIVYMTDIVGLSAGAAGAIYGITKIWAGATDLFVGSQADKVNTKWGRLRPFLLFGSTPLAVVFVLLFSTPAGLSPTGALVWIFLLDAAFQLCYSLVNIPYGSLASSMTQDPVDRSKLSGSRSIASSLAGVALAWVVSPQFQDLSDVSKARTQFTYTCIILAVIAVILYLICFANSREVVPRSAGKISFGQTFSMLKQNKPLKILLLMGLFFLTSNFVFNAIAIFYVREIIGNAGFFAIVQLSLTAGTVLFASFAPTITRRFGKRNGYVLACILAIIGYTMVAVMPGGNYTLAVIAWFFLGLGTGGSNAMMFSMQADTVDYGEWKSNIRSEGGSYSILSFTRKVGQGVGGWLGGAVIGWYGYSQGVEITEHVEQGLRIATGAIPAVLAVVAALIAWFYPLSGAKHSEIIDELTERRTQASIAGSKGVDADATRVHEDSITGDGRTTLMRRAGEHNPPIITLFGQRGSGATEIGPMVADMLGVNYIDQAMSSKELSQVDKTALLSDSAFNRWMRTLSYSGTSTADLAVALDSAHNRQVAQGNVDQVLADVENGGVILGRNGALILGSVVGTLHVRLVAPMERRVERVMHKTGFSASDAAEQCEIEDRLRREISYKLHKWDPTDDEAYDLVINTASTTYKQVAELIVEMYRSKYPENVSS